MQVVALLALVLPSQVRADDGPLPLSPDSALTTADTIAAVEAAVAAAVELPAAPITAEEAVSAVVSPADIPLPVPDAVNVEAPAAPVLSDAATPAAQPAAAPLPEQPSVQAAAAPEPPSSAPAGTTPAPPEAPDTQYQPENDADTIASEKGDPVAPVFTSGSSVDPPDTWVWNWEWNCASDGAAPPMDPLAGTASSWVWSWRWNCGAPEPAADGCAACNTAVSVRVFSPGDDGPVIQNAAATTLTAVTAAAATVQSAARGLTREIRGPPTPPAAPTVPVFGVPLLPVPAPPLPATAPTAFAPSAAAVLEALPVFELPGSPPAPALELLAGELDLVAGILAGPAGPPSESRPGSAPPARAAPDGARRGPVLFPAWGNPAETPALVGDPQGYEREPTTGRRPARTASPDGPNRPPAPAPRRAPFGPPTSQPSATGAASGSGGSAGGIAVLLGVLCAFAPFASRWLRVAHGSPPRAPHASRPERPG